jgi:hypothetical protein
MFGSKREERPPTHRRVQAALAATAQATPPVVVSPAKPAAQAAFVDTALSDPQPTDRLGLVDRATLDSLVLQWASRVRSLPPSPPPPLPTTRRATAYTARRQR